MLSQQVQEMAEASKKERDLDPFFNAKKKEQVCQAYYLSSNVNFANYINVKQG